MIKDWGSFAWPVLGIACAVAVLFVLVFDRYRYYDFSATSCDAGAVALTAGLIGDFGKRHATRRGSPYRLRMEATRPQGDARVFLDKVRLVSLRTGAIVMTNGGEMSAVSGRGNALVLLGEPVDLSYDDYRVQGIMAVGDAGLPEDHDFVCVVKRNYRSEWRASWFDALMSV